MPSVEELTDTVRIVLIHIISKPETNLVVALGAVVSALRYNGAEGVRIADALDQAFTDVLRTIKEEKQAEAKLN